MISAFLHRIAAAGVGPAIFGFGLSLLMFVALTGGAGLLSGLRRRPLLAACAFTGFYLLVVSGGTKPPVKPPDPAPADSFTIKIWRDSEERLILIQSPVWEITP